MTLINNNSIVNGKLDEDLKSELIAITIEEVRKKEFYKKVCCFENANLKSRE